MRHQVLSARPRHSPHAIPATKVKMVPFAIFDISYPQAFPFYDYSTKNQPKRLIFFRFYNFANSSLRSF